MAQVHIDIDSGTSVHWARTLPIHNNYDIDEMWNLFESLELGDDSSDSDSPSTTRICYDRLIGARVHVTKQPYEEMNTELLNELAASYHICERNREKVIKRMNALIAGVEWEHVRRELTAVLEAAEPPLHVWFEVHQPQSIAKTIDLPSEAFDKSPWEAIETVTATLSDETMLDSLAALAFVAIDCYCRAFSEVCDREDIDEGELQDALERGRLIVKQSQAVDSILRNTARYESIVGDAEQGEFIFRFDEPEHYENIEKLVTDHEYVGQAFSIETHLDHEVAYIVGAGENSYNELTHYMLYRVGPETEISPVLVHKSKVERSIERGELKPMIPVGSK